MNMLNIWGVSGSQIKSAVIGASPSLEHVNLVPRQLSSEKRLFIHKIFEHITEFLILLFPKKS